MYILILHYRPSTHYMASSFEEINVTLFNGQEHTTSLFVSYNHQTVQHDYSTLKTKQQPELHFSHAQQRHNGCTFLRDDSINRVIYCHIT